MLIYGLHLCNNCWWTLTHINIYIVIYEVMSHPSISKGEFICIGCTEYMLLYWLQFLVDVVACWGMSNTKGFKGISKKLLKLIMLVADLLLMV